MPAKKTRPLSPPLLAAGLLALSLGVGALLMFFPWQGKHPGSIQVPQGRELKLYFASLDDGQYLLRPFRIQDNLVWVEQIKNIIEAMFAQPSASGETSLWPFVLRVRSVFLMKSGTLVLDLEEGVTYNQNSTAAAELRVVRSLTNTLVANFPEVRAVKFLVNGSEAETLAGHIDISRAMGEND
jgi:spore germination protein GerM